MHMQNVKLSILIPVIERDRKLYRELFNELCKQQLPVYSDTVEICVDWSETDSVGAKRNRLLDRAKGQYVVFIDADDWIDPLYIATLMLAVESGRDCASLRGLYSVDGVTDGIFEHSLKYKAWRTTGNAVKHERYPNHLNCIRADIAKQFRFPEINHGEDHDWSTQIHKSGLLKTEFYIPQVLYYYRKITRHV
jgi:glycosyltransferase involved in cell wall biosynthesis